MYSFAVALVLERADFLVDRRDVDFGGAALLDKLQKPHGLEFFGLRLLFVALPLQIRDLIRESRTLDLRCGCRRCKGLESAVGERKKIKRAGIVRGGGHG